MSNYTGAKCLSCDRVFDTNDDIVVCPECGTPYHRECYLKEGKCVNDELHKSGGSWIAENKPEIAVEEKKTVRCIRCGSENPAEEHVCRNCGTPLVNMESPRPFAGNDGEEGGFTPENHFPTGAVMFNQDSEINGVKLGDYARYVGTNPMGYLPNFIRFGKYGRKISFNFFAMFFPELYFMYRKMRPWGILSVVIMSLLSVPDLIELFQEGYMGMKMTFGIDVKSAQFVNISLAMRYASMVLKILAGLFANYLYYLQANTDITKIRSENDTDDIIKMKIIGKGGTSFANVVLAFLLSSMVSLGVIWIMVNFPR